MTFESLYEAPQRFDKLGVFRPLHNHVPLSRHLQVDRLHFTGHKSQVTLHNHVPLGRHLMLVLLEVVPLRDNLHTALPSQFGYRPG